MEGEMKIRKMVNFFMGIGCFIILAAGPVASAMIDVTVDGRSMPWSTSLNPGYLYGINDGTVPTVVDSNNSGISFASGAVLVISYISGYTMAYGSYLAPNADGVTDYTTKSYSSYPTVADSPGSTGNFYPTLFMTLPDNANAKYYVNALVGTFTNASGVIVGDPFYIGNGPYSVSVPTGATQ
jgi:hypothetical protein